MTNSQVRSSITKYKEALEISATRLTILPGKTVMITDMDTYTPHTETQLNPAYLTQPITSRANFNSDIAAWCLDSIVKDHNVNAACGRIRRIRDDGKSVK